MMSTATAWIVAGLVACAAEMVLPGVFLLPIGLAACATGIAIAVSGLGGTFPLVVFLAFTAALVGAAAWRIRRRGVHVDTVNAPAAGLVGQTCRALMFEGTEGRVALGDGTWRARTADQRSPPAGSVLDIVGLDGTTLLVRTRDPA